MNAIVSLLKTFCVDSFNLWSMSPCGVFVLKSLACSAKAKGQYPLKSLRIEYRNQL